MGSLIILPLYVQFYSERIGVSAEVSVLSESVTAEKSRLDRDELIAARKRIDAIEIPTSREGVAAKILRAVVERKPPGAHITAVEYIFKSGNGVVQISGTVQKRADLQTYVSSLELDSLFSSVSVPASAFSSGKDTFVITAESVI